MPQSGPVPIGELGNTVSSTTEIGVDDTILDFLGLTPNSPYQIEICARTNTGCGDTVKMIQCTTEDGAL